MQNEYKTKTQNSPDDNKKTNCNTGNLFVYLYSLNIFILHVKTTKNCACVWHIWLKNKFYLYTCADSISSIWICIETLGASRDER